MAKAVGLIGTLKGKVGNTVFATVRGETIARVYQPTVTNPNTYRQQMSRALMSKGGRIARAMLDFERIGWNNVAPGRAFQQAVKQMVDTSRNAFNIMSAVTPQEITVNYANMPRALSYAEIPSPTASVPDFDTEGLVKFDLNISDECAYGDESSQTSCGIVAMAYQPDTNEATVYKTTGASGSVSIGIPVPASWSGLRVHVYAFVKRLIESGNPVTTSRVPWRTPSKCSQTIYVGTGDVA